eukprot:scaffold17833_cov112-Isochrysis_galbana.AAC.2
MQARTCVAWCCARPMQGASVCRAPRIPAAGAGAVARARGVLAHEDVWCPTRPRGAMSGPRGLSEREKATVRAVGGANEQSPSVPCVVLAAPRHADARRRTPPSGAARADAEPRGRDERADGQASRERGAIHGGPAGEGGRGPAAARGTACAGAASLQPRALALPGRLHVARHPEGCAMRAAPARSAASRQPKDQLTRSASCIYPPCVRAVLGCGGLQHPQDQAGD